MSLWQQFKNSQIGRQVRRRRHIMHALAAVKEQEGGLQRTLTTLSLSALGIGCVVGAGIFVITGQAAAKYAGPSLTLCPLCPMGPTSGRGCPISVVIYYA